MASLALSKASERQRGGPTSERSQGVKVAGWAEQVSHGGRNPDFHSGELCEELLHGP